MAPLRPVVRFVDSRTDIPISDVLDYSQHSILDQLPGLKQARGPLNLENVAANPTTY